MMEERNHNASVTKTFTEKHVSIFRERIKKTPPFSFTFGPLVNETGT